MYSKTIPQQVASLEVSSSLGHRFVSLKTKHEKHYEKMYTLQLNVTLPREPFPGTEITFKPRSDMSH